MQSEATHPYGVLISHASEDRWVASCLAERVRQAGATPFLDATDVDDGDDFEERILEAADASHELLVLLTPWALAESRYVWMEIGAFWSQRKRIVVLLLGLTVEALQKDRGLPNRLKRAHLRSLNDADAYFERLSRRAAARGPDDE